MRATESKENKCEEMSILSEGAKYLRFFALCVTKVADCKGGVQSSIQPNEDET